MKDRYDNQLEIGDTVIVATLSRKSAYLRQGVVKDIKTECGREIARIFTEARGTTRVTSKDVVKVFTPDTANNYAQMAA